MSLTALILTQTIARRDVLNTQHGRTGVDHSLFVLASRLIAGAYNT